MFLMMSHAMRCCNHHPVNIAKNQWLTPGYIVTMAAHWSKKSAKLQECFTHEFCDQEQFTYLNTIGFFYEVFGEGDKFRGSGAGYSYAPLVKIENEIQTDAATTTINDCISRFTKESVATGVGSFQSVVGELHDNVWAHGKSTGFSCAQQYKGGILHFAIADRGGGLLKELKRVGLNIASDEDAIEWCIQEEHSSKRFSQENNDWAQQLPPDIIGGNPMGQYAKFQSQSQHAGLGLYKLITFCTKYGAELEIYSGNGLLRLPLGRDNMAISRTDTYWDGVAISCRVRLENLTKSTENDQALTGLMHVLTS